MEHLFFSDWMSEVICSSSSKRFFFKFSLFLSRGFSGKKYKKTLVGRGGENKLEGRGGEVQEHRTQTHMKRGPSTKKSILFVLPMSNFW